MSAKEAPEVLAGVVRDGKVVLKDSRLPEGTRVAVRVLEPDDESDTFEVSPEEKAELLASIAEAERGEGMDAYDHLRQLRECCSVAESQDTKSTAVSGPNDQGVDLTLVDAALRMTPEERLLHNDRMVTTALELRAAVEAATHRDG